MARFVPESPANERALAPSAGPQPVGEPGDVNAWISAIMATLRRLVPGTDETSREDRFALMRECFGDDIVGAKGYRLKVLSLAALQEGFGRLSGLNLAKVEKTAR